MSALTEKIAQRAAAKRAEAFRNGDFSEVRNVKDTGLTFDADQAMADSAKPELRLKSEINGELKSAFYARSQKFVADNR